MIFGGYDRDYLRVREGLFRPPTPPIEFNTSEKSTGGSRRISKRFTDMELPVPVTIKNPHGSIEDLKEDIATWLYSEIPKKLIFKQNIDRYYMAEYSHMDLDEKHGIAKGEIMFYLADGHRYGELNQMSISPVKAPFSIKGARPMNWKSTTIFANPTTRFFLECDGQIIEIYYNFVKGDKLEIDRKTREIKINDTMPIDVGLTLDSIWFELKPGMSQIHAKSKTTIEYTEKYY